MMMKVTETYPDDISGTLRRGRRWFADAFNWFLRPETASRWASQETARLLPNLKAHCRVQ
jgi:hypothetical protein